jgi:cephalosporin hydroxylase
MTKGSITIDFDRGTVTVSAGGRDETFSIGSAQGFAAASRAWLRSGWDAKYVYGFTWMGRPIIQLPDDLLRMQEVIYAVRPTVIIETGVAHGGSLIFYASLLKAMAIDGRVIGIDVEIRPHNRAAIDAHELSGFLSLVEGSSVDPAVVARVRGTVAPGATVLVVLDSNHTRAHVLSELEAYGPLVSVGSYIVAADGITKDLVGAPRSRPDWGENNPTQAAREFVSRHPEFVIEEPAWPFNEGVVDTRVTYWPDGFIRRVR